MSKKFKVDDVVSFDEYLPVNYDLYSEDDDDG
jgi:hypothetical protein